jgi:hypothetical protein
VSGSALPNGSADLASLTDVTDRITIDTADAVFNRTRGTVTLTAFLVNTSTEAILLPVKVRVLSLSSKLAKVEVANADNKEVGAGAIWNFADRLAGGRLRPGERSKSKELVFSLKDIRVLDSDFSLSDESNPPDFVRLTAKVLGKLDKITPTDSSPAPASTDWSHHHDLKY